MKKSIEIRDPLHGVIWIDSSFAQVLDHPIFQRLRFIRQLDFMEFSFPGAIHSRFLHALGSFYLSEKVFDQVFSSFKFSKKDAQMRLKVCFKLAALLHDIGHGPLSHASERAMPSFLSLWPKKDQSFSFNKIENTIPSFEEKSLKPATHEDYTIKFLLDSNLSEKIRSLFSDVDPLFVASLIDSSIKVENDFFIDQGVYFRPILSQLISSDLDIDRMDYLGRDAYFCGVALGRVDWNWLISNMTYYEKEGNLFLALYRRAFPSFEQFLFTRHQMRLMVYFHYKSVIYKEILNRYFLSKKGSFLLPSSIEEYTEFTDHTLFEHLFGEAKNGNFWAQCIVKKNPYKLLFESYSKRNISEIDLSLNSNFKMKKSHKSQKPLKVKQSFEKSLVEKNYQSLKEKKIQVILSQPSSHFNFLSSFSIDSKPIYPSLFLVDVFNPTHKPKSIESEQSVKFFKQYEQAHSVERLYVVEQEFSLAQKHLEAEF